jgi:hypothetical protein
MDLGRLKSSPRMAIVIVIRWTPDYRVVVIVVVIVVVLRIRNHALVFFRRPKLANSSTLPRPQVGKCLEEKCQIMVETKPKGHFCENYCQRDGSSRRLKTNISVHKYGN